MALVDIVQFYTQGQPSIDELTDDRAEMQLYLDKSADIYRSTGSQIQAVGGQNIVDVRSGRVPDNMGGTNSTYQRQQTLPCTIGSIRLERPEDEETAGFQPVEINHFMISFQWDADVRIRDHIVESGNTYIVEDTDAGDSYRLLLNCVCTRLT